MYFKYNKNRENRYCNKQTRSHQEMVLYHKPHWAVRHAVFTCRMFPGSVGMYLRTIYQLGTV